MKKLISIALAVLCMLLPASAAAHALTEKPLSLTVVMKYGGLVLPGIKIAVCRVASAREEGGRLVYEAVPEFSGAGADFTGVWDRTDTQTKEKNIALAASLNAYAAVNNIARSVKPTDSNGRAPFTGLSPGLYLVAQAQAEESDYSFAPYLVSVPSPSETRDGWDYDVTVYPKPTAVHGTSVICISVHKIWVGTVLYPSSVQVQLYRNGSPHGKPVTLSAKTYWSWTWDNLDPSGTWTVDEPDVPIGYVKAVTGNVTNGFIIANTRDPLVPTLPVTTPGVTGTPGTSTPGETGVLGDSTVSVPHGGSDTPPHGDGSNGNGGNGGNGDAPKTEDASNMQLWVLLTSAGLVGLLVTICVGKSKRTARKPARG